MMKRFGHFLRRVRAAWLERKFAMLDREIRWNAEQYEMVMDGLRRQHRMTWVDLTRMRLRK